jgi:hypothetical protein
MSWSGLGTNFSNAFTNTFTSNGVNSFVPFFVFGVAEDIIKMGRIKKSEFSANMLLKQALSNLILLLKLNSKS